MNFSALEIFIGQEKAGILFKYGSLIRFQVDAGYAGNAQRALLSLSMRAGDPAQDAALLLNPLAARFNSPGGGRLPPFFQNLLPEGVLRKHIAALRQCAENDYFELLAACGADLPGNVMARPAPPSPALVMQLLEATRSADQESPGRPEESIMQAPLPDAVSISGMQPKLPLLLQGGRYVSGRRLGDAHIIGKLPTTQYDMLPEVEYLSLQLAAVAGVTVCEATLQPLSLIDASHDYVLGGSGNFLAVRRFDRDQPGRLHAEDFAQILGVDPEYKYTGGSYADIARVMQKVDGLGEGAVLELMRRITVSELLGNYDFHLKNIGVLHYPDGRIALSPAYDIVAYSAYMNGNGHALAFSHGQPKRLVLGPATLRLFANDAGVPEAKLRNEIRKVCTLAMKHWPAMITASDLRPQQKDKLHMFMTARPVMQSLLKRQRVMAG